MEEGREGWKAASGKAASGTASRRQGDYKVASAGQLCSVEGQQRRGLPPLLRWGGGFGGWHASVGRMWTTLLRRWTEARR